VCREKALFEFVTYAARNPKFRERFAAGRQEFKAALADVLTDRIAAHRLQPVAGPEQLAVLVTALVNGLALDELTERGGISGDLLATALLALIDPERQPGQP
jgi:BetI-type transcriptional repressor, C-terminal